MTAQRYIKQAIIASLCEHPDQDKYKTRAFAGENLKNVMEIMGGKGRQKLSKADFFAADDDGKIIIDTPGFWKNFDQVLQVIRQNGEHFTTGDFLKSFNGREDGRNLLDSAIQHNGLSALFAAKTWQGHYDDMERLWYVLTSAQRQTVFKNEGLIDLDLKRQLLAAEGISLPEDRLAKAGVKADDIMRALQDRTDYEALKKKLAAHNDYLRKSYLLLPDREGNTVFSRKSSWAFYGDIVSNMMKHDERFEIADFIRQNGRRLNILARAAENNALHQIFTPAHWADRLDDMLQLWSCVLPGWKTGLATTKDFDVYYAEAEDLTYAKLVDLSAMRRRADLVTPVNAGNDNEKPVLPLGLKSVWENFDTVANSIKASPVTLADLRLQSGGLGHSCLVSAVKFGAFGKVGKLLQQSGEQLEVSDFLSKDRHGTNLLTLLAERNELTKAFAPELWTGRLADMKTLWTHVRISDRKQIDIHQLEVAVKQATLKQQAANRFKLPQPPQ